MKQCQKIFSEAKNPIYPDIQICAGGIKGEDSCAGDSGSGLIDVSMTNGSRTIRYKIVGIVSWGTNKCGIGKPGVYVKVSAYLDWIMDNLCKYICLVYKYQV